MATLVQYMYFLSKIIHVFIFRLTVAEILDKLENGDDEDVRDIFIEPPDVADCTDEDSADEDGGGMVENFE